jgi:iron complex outermembrane receptor protein
VNERALIATLLATACTSAVQAADPPEENAGLDEIIVTAGRRAESLQDVAASVTAFTPESLSRSGINTTVDLQLRTPGLLVSTNGSFGQPYLRGIGSDVINPGADAPVAVFIDGAYQPRPTSAITDFFDVERVEVLKDPQGTLYGRNATGGAIRLVTRDPGEEFAAEADALFGNYERRRVRAAANLPLGDAAAVRVAGYYAERDGFTRNLFTGRRLDDEDLWGVRAKLRIASTERFSLVAGAERVREDSTRNNAAKVVDSPALPLPVRDLAPLLGYAPPAIPADPFEVRVDFQPRTFLEQTRANATAEWKLAAVTLTSITGYTRVRNVGDFDLDATEIDFSYDREADRSRSYTQTLQLSSADTARLSWIAGVEYLNERASQNFDARLPLFGPPSPIRLGPASPVAGFVWDSSLRTRAASAFLDGGYEMTPRLTVSAGVRYSREKKDAGFTQTLIDPFGILTGGASLAFGGRIVIPAQPQRTFEAWTPRVRIEFRPADDLLLYAAATRGFKSGGFNLILRVPPSPLSGES